MREDYGNLLEKIFHMTGPDGPALPSSSGRWLPDMTSMVPTGEQGIVPGFKSLLLIRSGTGIKVTNTWPGGVSWIQEMRQNTRHGI